MNRQRRQEIRNNLWEENPYCHWCGRLTVPPVRPRPTGNYIDPRNTATLDHLFVKHNPARHEYHPTKELFVLACAKCNSHRGFEDGKKHLRSLSKEMRLILRAKKSFRRVYIAMLAYEAG